MDKDENIKIDVNAFEEARYQEILDSGKYIELKILVGTKKEQLGGTNGIIPCVRMELHNANPETIGVLYSSIKLFAEHLEEEYPLECMLSKLTHKTKEIGKWDVDVEQKSKPKRKKKE